MSNLNIQQKVSLINQKTKENKVKDSNLTDEQQRINDYNENIKPTLYEDESALIQKYHTKLSVLGEYKVNPNTPHSPHAHRKSISTTWSENTTGMSQCLMI